MKFFIILTTFMTMTANSATLFKSSGGAFRTKATSSAGAAGGCCVIKTGEGDSCGNLTTKSECDQVTTCAWKDPCSNSVK